MEITENETAEVFLVQQAKVEFYYYFSESESRSESDNDVDREVKVGEKVPIVSPGRRKPENGPETAAHTSAS